MDENTLLQKHKGLAYRVLKTHYPNISQYIEFEDAEMLCLEGLLKAIRTYREETGNAFSTYAIPVIKNHLFIYLRTHKNRIKFNKSAVSLEQPITNEDDSLLAEIIPDKNNIEEEFIKDDEHTKLHKFISELPEDLKIIMNLVLKDMTQDEIAKYLNISQTYVNRLYKKALYILRYKYKVEGGIIHNDFQIF